MLKAASLFLIEFYQRFVSPHKGFHCAHHRLHQGYTCSNAIKQLITKHGVLHAWPLIRLRFKECSMAYQILNSQHADIPIPCDLSCALDIASCGSSAPTSNKPCTAPCDLLELLIEKRRNRNRWLIALLVASLALGYWFYGRGIHAIQVSEVSTHTSNIFERLSQRNEPSIRVLIEADGKDYYSNIATLTDNNSSLRLEFEDAPLSYKIDSVKILDARINLANELIVLGQILEEYTAPETVEEGERFNIELHRRWHLF